MKQLETTFTQDNAVFTQVKRNDKAALYRRETPEGQFVQFEVFAIRTKDEAEIYPGPVAVSKWLYCPISEDRANIWFDRFTNGEVVIPDVDPITGEAAPADERNIDEIPDVVVDVNVETPAPTVDDPTAPDVAPTVDLTPDGGAAVTVAKVTKAKVAPTYLLPNGEFTRTDFANLNGLKPCNSESYGALMKMVKAGLCAEVRKDKTGKGKPKSIYAAVTPAPAVVAAPADVTPATV